MHEILRHLAESSIVLDLGSGRGSFDADSHSFMTVRTDLEAPEGSPPGNFVEADAGALPFKSKIFDAVICNHSLEHFQQLDAALQEVGRVIKDRGALFVSVPDASTFSDILYRWLARGGGHVNAFRRADELVPRIQEKTRLPHIATRPLCTSLSFLNRNERPAARPKRMLLFFGGSETFLLVLNGVLRLLDRLLGSRTSMYGWALYFGRIEEPVSTTAWSNVCVRCGSGHPSDWLVAAGLVTRRWRLLRLYLCPTCGARNLFVRDTTSNRAKLLAE